MKRPDVRARIARSLGGEAGTITGGTLSSAVLGGLAGTTNDDKRWIGAMLAMPDGAAADRQRVVTGWTPGTGTVQWTGALGTAPANGDRYELYPKKIVTLTQVNEAINEALRKARRSVEIALPTLDGTHYHSLGTALPWVRSHEDIDGVFLRSSPCLIPNEEMTLWGDGEKEAPTGWKVTGTNATVERIAALGEFGPFAARLTRVGADARLTRTVGTLRGWLRGTLNGTQYQGDRRVTVLLEATCSAASRLRAGVYDGVSTMFSAFNVSTGREVLEVTAPISANATTVQVFAEISAGDASADIDRLIAQEGASIDATLRARGSDAFPRQRVDAMPKGLGGDTVLEITTSPGMQLLVVSRMPYPEFADDTEESDADADTIEHGAIFFLARRHREGEDGSRWDELRQTHGRAWLRGVGRLIQRPPRDPVAPVEVKGA